MSLISKKHLRILSLFVACVFVITLIPVITLTQSAKTSADSRPRVGCWWWHSSDGNNASIRDSYLNLLEQAGVTEIYYYDYSTFGKNTSSSKSTIHTFVQAAASHGMRVAIMMDDPALVTNASTSKSEIQKLANAYSGYIDTYPQDNLYGFHFDAEGFTKNTANLQLYVDNLVGNCQTYLMPLGAVCEFDVNPVWNGASGVTKNGVTGFYNVLASILANGKGTLGLMAYRLTAEKTMNRANQGGALTACKQYNCDFVVGFETAYADSETADISLYGKSKNDAYTLLNGILTELNKGNYPCYYGAAIHHARALSELSGEFSTTSTWNGGGTSGSTRTIPSVTSTKAGQATTTKKASSGTLEKIALYDGDVSGTYSVSNYFANLNNNAINTAVRNDIATNGVISGNEYYEIITTGSCSGSSGYATSGFRVGGDDQLWGTDPKTNPDCSTLKSTPGTHMQMIDSSLGARMDQTTEFGYWTDGNSDDKVTPTHVTIYVYRVKGGQEEPTTTTKTTTTTTTTKKPTTTTTTKATTTTVGTSAQTQASEIKPSTTAAEVSNEPFNTSSDNQTTIIIPSTTIAEGPVYGLIGDVNEDTKVDMKDVLALRKFLAGMLSDINESNADVTLDGTLDMKDVLKLRRCLAGLDTLPTRGIVDPTKPTDSDDSDVSDESTAATEVPTTTTTLATTTTTTVIPTTTTTTVVPEDTNWRERAPYTYNASGEPILSFRKPTDGTVLATWWWFTSDSDNITTRDKYLNFLQENGCSEIYYYGYYYLQRSNDRKTLHKFVQAANEKGMKVSLIYDDADTICDRKNSELTTICNEYLTYMKEYPDDLMNGIHFDCEHKPVQNFAGNLVSQFKAAVERGVPIGMDVNCEMSMAQVTCNGTTYDNIYDCICDNATNITLMSYKDSFETIWNLGKNAYASAVKYGCECVFAVETGAYDFNDPHDEFAQESKEYMYEEFAEVYYNLKDNHPTGGYGVAVHNHGDWYKLQSRGY